MALATGVRIVGDDLNNAVLIYAPPAEFRKIEDTLKRLDAPATQVMIEATIIEVSLRDELQYGLQWYFTDSNRANMTGVGQLNTNNAGGIRPILPGFSYSLIDSVGQIRVVLNMLADRSLVRVISSPSLMVLDNHTAAISVGDQQPIRSSETVTVGGNVTTAIEYKDTGVLLAVTPTVSAGDMVAMTINQSVTDVGAIDAATGQRSFLQRQIGSRVAVRSGEALVLGGLIKDGNTQGSLGIPFLSRIPVIGALFGTQTQDSQRTELLVVITPRVVRTPFDAREVGVEMRDRMRGFRALVEQQSPLLPKPLVEQVTPPPAAPQPPATPPATPPTPVPLPPNAKP
ncbi:MAG: type II secretion system protein GspD [Burkholderiales bacterium]|nr:type II secretion system protein GspD [Burkholderiales bacterium]